MLSFRLDYSLLQKSIKILKLNYKSTKTMVYKQITVHLYALIGPAFSCRL